LRFKVVEAFSSQRSAVSFGKIMGEE